MAPVVVAESLTKRFGKLTAVEDLSFALEPGTITGFLGPNGTSAVTGARQNDAHRRWRMLRDWQTWREVPATEGRL